LLQASQIQYFVATTTTTTTTMAAPQPNVGRLPKTKDLSLDLPLLY
jgi:hypothetical protein